MSERAKKQDAGDPTLGEVFEFMKDGFTRIYEKFDSIEEEFNGRFAEIGEQLVKAEKGSHLKFKAFNERMDTQDARLGEIHRNIRNIRESQVDTLDEFEVIKTTLDAESESIVEHETRIRVLEKAVAS